MKKTFFILFVFTLFNFHLSGQPTLETVSCESQIVQELIQTQVRQINKHAWKGYQISNKLLGVADSSTGELKRYCLYISDMGMKIPGKGTLNDTIINSSRNQIYFIYQPVYDRKSDRFMIKVTRWDGEWGGVTLNYFYNKTRRRFKLTKVVVVRTTC